MVKVSLLKLESMVPPKLPPMAKFNNKKNGWSKGILELILISKYFTLSTYILMEFVSQMRMYSLNESPILFETRSVPYLAFELSVEFNQ